MSEKITILSRPRCRIDAANPDSPDFKWDAVAPLPALTMPGEPVAGDTTVRAAITPKALHVRFECVIPDMREFAPMPPYAKIGEAEHVFLTVHPDNDAGRSVKFRGDFRGVRDATVTQSATGESSLGDVRDNWQDTKPFVKPWTWYQDFRTGFWSFEFIIPWRSLDHASPPPTIGFGYGRMVRCIRVGSNMTAGYWPDPALLGPAFSPSFEHGEAILGNKAGAPSQLDIVSPRFGSNEAVLHLGKDWPAPVTAVRVKTPAGETTTKVTPNAEQATIAFKLDRAHSSHLNPIDAPRVRLDVLAGDATAYSVAFLMDRHRGVCVDEPFGESAAKSAPGATPRERLLDRIIRALPRLHRHNTREGAPSDFCLIDDVTGEAIDLMSDEPWKPLAAIIESRFKTTEERLIAAMALIGQKSVTNLILEPMFFNNRGQHSYHSAMQSMLGPLSIIRYGGGPADSRATVLARFLEHITDPATGRTFTTRAVWLHRDGGPRQVDRQYEASSSPAPFMMHPGVIGCAAVDYDGSQTLLDPTAFAFFPLDDNKLATVERITADADLRKQGAGLLADAYGKLDIEEMRRHLPNQLHSKGVYPEACPDEQLPNRPFDPAQRQVNRSFHAVRGGKAATVDPLTLSNGNAGERSGAVDVAWDDDALTVTIHVTGITPSAFDARDRSAERVQILIDPEHKHTRFHHITVHLDGRRMHTHMTYGNIQTLFKHLTTESCSTLETFGNENWSAEVTERNDGYDVTCRIQWAALRIFEPDDRPAVIGLNVLVDGRHPNYEQITLSPPRFLIYNDPFSYADVYLAEAGDPVVNVDEVDFGIAYFGENIARVRLVNRDSKPVDAVVQMRTHAGFSRELFALEPVRVTLAPGEFARVKVPYYVDPRHKMTPGNSQLIELTLRVAERTRYEGMWESNYCGMIAGYQRYDLDPAKCPNPKPGEKDFAEKKMRYVASRIGAFHRLTTRDGAKSDFILRSADGSVEFNLMDDGILERMATWAASHFDTDVDRVLGVYALGYNPAVLRHMSFGHRLMTGASPISVLRGNFAGGGGNCGYHSRAFGGMLANLKINGDYLIGHTVGIWGHVISAFSWRGSKAIVDNDVGHFMLNKDGTDFATIEEFRADPDVITTAGPCDLARYFTFNINALPAQKTVKGYPWPGSFPPNASAE